MDNSIATDQCLFIFAQGRSGSTLLLELLNEIDGVNICGENNGALKHLEKFHGCLRESIRNSHPWGDDKPKFTYREILEKELKPAWYNVFEYKSILEQLRSLIREMYNPHGDYRVWGFKEIRHGLGGTYNAFESELDFIKLMFPGSRFVFNTRSIHDLLQSGWWADHPERSRKRLSYQYACFEEYFKIHNDYCYMVAYEDIVAKSVRFIELYDFIQEKFESDVYEMVLNRPKRDR